MGIMQKKYITKYLLIWNPYFSEEENIIFEKFTQKLLEDYNPQLVVLTVEQIKKESFDNVIAAIVFSDSACTKLSEKIADMGLVNLPVILSIISQQNSSYENIRAFPSAKTVGQLLAKALYKEEGEKDSIKIVSFFLPEETARICANAFEESVQWLYPKTDPDIIICSEEPVGSFLKQCKEKVDSETCVVIYGYDANYNELLKALIDQNPKRIISEFNTPDSFAHIPNLSYVCFEVPLTGIALFKKIAQTLLDTLDSYIKSIDKDATMKRQRKELRRLLVDQSRFRKTALGTFHFTENNDFFCPFYLKYGSSDRVELLEGTESPAEIAVTALSECNKWLDKFTCSTDNDAFQRLLQDIGTVLKNKLFCERFFITSQVINHWYSDNSKYWEFIHEFPYLFDQDSFWEKDDMDSISVKKIQVSLNKPDLEDFASYRIYVNDKEPFIKYLHADKITLSSLSIAKSSEENGIEPLSSKDREVELFVDKLKRKCREIWKEVDYVYFIFLRQKEEKQNLQQCVCYCFYTKEKLGVFELTILENIAVIINHTIFEVAYKKELLEESIKSAISAIMARNMSHNLGSHFISNTKHYFSDLAEKATDTQRQKDYRGIRHTLQYIQERMDFIATIVSTDRFPYGPVNVKSQIFDELTPDEFGERHEKATTNFLLEYIVYSEDISKQSNTSKSKVKLLLKLISDNGKKFGGQSKNENQEAKEEFAKLNLAVPGGILGRHAIFTIIENVIRNSAKHDKESIPKDGLTVSIKIGKDHLVIFDNKKNANKKINGVVLKEELCKRYAEIKILSDGIIDKSNKGLKEILISALWLNNHSLADWFSEYENIPDKNKIERLSGVLKVVAVDDNGDVTDDGENLGYSIALDKYENVYYIKDDIVVDNKINYSGISGIKADIIVAKKDYEVLIDADTHQNEYADLESKDVLRLSNLYPRFYENRDGGGLPAEEMMKAIIERNTGVTVKELNDINIHIEPKNNTSYFDTSNINHCIWHITNEATGIRKNDILYKNHLSTLKTEEIDRVLAAYSGAAYIDSISGGDFTGTITQPFFLQDEFSRLKVIESALTEFVIIDERIFKNYGHGLDDLSGSHESKNSEVLLYADEIFNEVERLLALGKSGDDISDDIAAHYHIELNVSVLMKGDKALIREDIDNKMAQKNSENAPKTMDTESRDHFVALHKMIERRKLHIYDIDKNGNIIDLHGMNVANVIDLNDMKSLCSPTFLSIHLSIIEKIAKENRVKASEVMKNLKVIFGNTKFVTIHSGRGNLSAELEEDLKDYAFLSLSAIQAAMDDSKYFLSQLLYNNCYIGKGRLNHK